MISTTVLNTATTPGLAAVIRMPNDNDTGKHELTVLIASKADLVLKLKVERAAPDSSSLQRYAKAIFMVC